MTEEKLGIKETKEAIVGINEVSLLLVSRFKDGIQVGDFVAFWASFQNDPEFKAKLQTAYEGYNNIPDEVKDISLAEASELISLEVQYVPKLVKALLE
jgi:hypothetical protein